jgi:hypothetical protein
MITVEEKEDGTQVWTHELEGDYTFVLLSTLRPGDRLEADHKRTQARVLSRADLDDFAATGATPAEIYVRVRSATPADRVKPTRPREPGQGGGPRGSRNPE